jgi:predicted glycosyltransferase
MRYLFFTNTPAHVHLYRNAVIDLRERGHEVLVLARDYGCTTALLDWFDLSYTVYGQCDTVKSSLFRRLPGQYARIFRRTRAFDPDLIFGIGAYAAHAGALTRKPTILVHDSEPTSFDHAISRPFARAILTPAAFRKDLGPKHYRFRAFKESAYLHPDTYEPQADVRERLGLADDERYAILRFNAFGSHHDVGQSGFTPDQRRALVEHLAESVTVLVSDEASAGVDGGLPARPFDVHPALLHDALAEADLLVADTQTMVTEAALLGTPAVRSNSFVGESDMGNFLELERQGLVHNVERFDDVLEVATSIVETEGVKADWRRRRDEYVADLVNLTDVLVEVASNVGAVERIDALSKDAVETGVPKRIFS